MYSTNVSSHGCGPVVAYGMRIPLHQKCQQTCVWIPSMGVFETYISVLQLLICGSVVARQTYIPVRAPKQPTEVSVGRSVDGFGCVRNAQCHLLASSVCFCCCGVWDVHTCAPKLSTMVSWDT